MPDVTIFEIILIAAAFSSSLVAGFLFSFAVVIMPGLKSLDDVDFIRGFQAVDGVIQRGQPLFMLVWAGSLVLLLVAAVMGLTRLDEPWHLLVAGTALAGLLGVHLPTLVVNVPLNNRLQALQVEGRDPAELRSTRLGFERRWNRWNVFRTFAAGLVSLLLVVAVWSTAGP